MKDAKGHGSEKRGTHATGVNEVGKTPLNAREWTRSRVQPRTPGVHVETVKSGSSYTYPRVVHSASGLALSQMTGHPLEMSLKDFAGRLDAHLTGVDWKRSADELRADPLARSKVSGLGGMQRRSMGYRA